MFTKSTQNLKSQASYHFFPVVDIPLLIRLIFLVRFAWLVLHCYHCCTYTAACIVCKPQNRECRINLSLYTIQTLCLSLRVISYDRRVILWSVFILVDLRHGSEDYVTNLPKLATTERKWIIGISTNFVYFGKIEFFAELFCQNSRNFNKLGFWQQKTDMICQIKYFVFELYSSKIHLDNLN